MPTQPNANLNTDTNIELIFNEEVERFIASFTGRIRNLLQNQVPTQKPLPENPNYAYTLNSINNGASYSQIARELDVSVSAVRNYRNWLIRNGYLAAVAQTLSPREQAIVDLLYVEGLTVTEAAERLDVTKSFITNKRDSALAKGYQPPEPEEA